MNQKGLKGWVKHGDFIILDIICLQLSFTAAYVLLHGLGNPYGTDSFQFRAFILALAQLAVIVFFGNYHGILRRKRWDEFLAVVRFTEELVVIAVVFLFMVHRSATASRLQFGFTIGYYLVLDYLFRRLNKIRILNSTKKEWRKRSLVLITAYDQVLSAVRNMTGEEIYRDYALNCILLLDSDESKVHAIRDELEYDIPVFLADEESIKKLIHGWVDEVFILQPDYMPFSSKIMDELMEMGITVNYSLSAMNDERWPITDVRKLGNYRVLVSSMRFTTTGQMVMKRVMDVIGALIGCVLTGIIFIFVAPIIYIKSPGPVIFKQDRVGKNGRVFKLYKFRSMYLDAEERKAALLSENQISDGRMFKMEDDPRIIGGEKKSKKGKPKGIGNFIRRTSLDEFPQFFNVLKGDMSLVGTRPPTLDEWEKYDLAHRVRMSIKPGITGLWQVSGRSSITDFNEVVRLDKEYIEEWSLLLDLKLILKTIVVVLKRQGAR